MQGMSEGKIKMPKRREKEIEPGDKIRGLGISVLGKAPWGTHLCHFYGTKKDLIDVLVPYFKAGLKNNEYCLWVTSEPLNAEEAKKALKRRVKDLDHYIKKGQIEVIDYKNWYSQSGKFEPDKVLKGWARKEKQVLKKGFDGLRVTGNTFCLEDKGWKDFIEYEAAVNHVIGEHRMIAICSYPLDKCGATEIIDVISNHQSALIRRNGKWEIFDGSYYKREGKRPKRTEDRYEVLFEGSASGVLVADLGTKKFRYANPAVCRMLGYTAEELTQLGVQDIHRKEDLKHVISEFEAQARGEKTLASDIPCMRKDGSIVYADINTTRVFFEGRDCNVGFFTDVTQRRKAEEGLARYRNNLEELVAERTDELKEEITERKWAEEALKALIETTAGRIGQEFFDKIVSRLAEWLDADCVVIGKIIGEDKVHAYSMFLDGNIIHDYSYELSGTPCENVAEKGYCLYCKDISMLFPEDKDLKDLKAQGYVGVPLLDKEGDPIGILCVISRKNLSPPDQTKELMEVVAARASLEIERTRADEALQENEEILRATIESTADGILAVDEGGSVVQANERFAQLWRIPGKLLETNDDEKLLAFVLDQLEDPEAFLSKVNDLYGSTEESLDTLIFKDGRVFKRYSRPLIRDGKNRGRVWSFRDITERKRAEEEIESHKSFLEEVFSGIQEGIGIVDEDENIVYCNPAYADICEEEAEDLIGKNLFDYFKDEARSVVLKQIEDRKEGNVSTYELPLLTAKGKRKYVRVTSSPRLGEGGTYKGAIAAVLDITERKRAEEKLRNSKEFVENIFNGVSDAISVIDVSDYRIIGANRAFLAKWNLKEKDVIGKFCYRITHARNEPCEPRDDDCPLQETLQTGKPAKAEHLHGSREEEQRCFEVATYPLRNEKGEIDRVIHNATDITERKRIERMKDEFISTVSHELRTPLTSIHGALGLITSGKAGDVRPEIMKLLDIALRNSERLRGLIDDILDIQKIESGRVKFDLRPLELKSILETSLEDNKSFGEQFNVKFVMDDILPEVKVSADSNRLKQVMDNLLSNAAKFSPTDSSVEVSVFRHDEVVRVAVKDNGPGIPDDFKGKIFKKFTQADSSITRERRGTGLGLSIAKAIIEEHGGKIGFETEIDVGTTFYFDLPEWKDKKDESKKAK